MLFETTVKSVFHSYIFSKRKNSKMKLIVKNNMGAESVIIEIKSNETFMDLKERVEEEAGFSLDLNNIALEGKRITETQSVMEYFLSYGETEEETPSNVYCAVLGCNNTKASNPDKFFFEFPTEEIRCHQWALYCQRLNPGPGKKRLSITSESTICSDHFKPDQFVKDDNTLLKKTAVPCVVMPIVKNHVPLFETFETSESPKFCDIDTRSSFNDDLEDTKASDKMKLIVENSMGESVIIQIKSNETFMDLKERVAEEAGFSLDLNDIALKGKRITEIQSVMEYFLSYGETEEETPSNVYCAVPGCNNTKASNPDKVFFEFPTEEIRCHQWALYCQRLNPGKGKKRLSLTSESTICSDHFKPDQFVKDTNNLLKKTAVPCVEMPIVKNPVPLFETFETSESPKFCDNDTRSSFNDDLEDTKANFQFRLCRLCASAIDDYVLIFDELGRQLKIAEKINLCLPIEVQVTDAFPKQICKPCLAHLEEIFELADTSSLSQNKLINMPEEELRSEDLAGEEVVLGSTGFEINTEHREAMKGFCPLCKEGRMVVKQCLAPEPEEEQPTSIFSQALGHIDPLDLGGLKDNCIGKNYVFSVSDYSDSTIICDTSDSQLSPPQDFTTAKDPLKLNDCSSESDNDQISECYSSLNILSSEDSSIKNKIGSNPLSPINKESEVEADFLYLDTESENSNLQSLNESVTQTNHINKPVLYCMLCGNEFSNDDLLKHCFSHSYSGFYQCCACVAFFTSKIELEEHFILHKNEDVPLFFCENCTKQFPSELAMASHICESEAYCSICDKSFPDEIKLQNHCMYIHNTRKVHCCEKCGRVFKSEASMKYHQKAHQSEDAVKPYTCECCGKSFIRKSMFINHMTSSHKHSAFETPCVSCKICYEGFPTAAAAVSHMDNNHKLECIAESTYSFQMLTINRLFVCEFCERCYAEGAALNKHRDGHPTESPYECKFCDSSFASIEEVKIHRRNHLTDDVPTEYVAEFSVPKTFLCEYCERCFLNQTKYTEHLTVHYGPEPYQCRHCTLKYATLAEAMEHRALHGEASSPSDECNYYRPYECHYCSKTFAIEDALNKHIRMHTGEKPFICDQCGKGFSQSSGLYTHQKVHSSERPYSCSVCPRTFKIKGDRDVHVRKHSGDRPYKCEFCGKAFMTQHVYRQHTRIHTGERPYKCDVCGIAFRRSHVLTVHKRIHTGEKPNICDICGKRYRQKGDMQKHRRVQHGILSAKQLLNPLSC